MKFRKTLATLIAASALAIGAAGIASITGCEKNYELEKIVTSVNPSSEFENQAYDFLNAFSNEIPSEFVQDKSLNGSFYHDRSLVFEDDKETPKYGKGRFVFMLKSKEEVTKKERNVTPANITVGYTDTEEIKKILATNDAKIAKSNITFRRYTNIDKESYGYIEDMVAIMKGNQAAFYVKEFGTWKKGIVKINTADKMASVDYKKVCKQSVPVQDVRKYLELAEKFNRNYFKPQNSKSF